MSPSAPGRPDPVGEPGLPTAALRRGLGAFLFALVLSPLLAAETTERESAFAPYAGGDWPTADAQDYGYDAAALGEAIERIGADEGVYSVLLVRGGELIAEQYFREGTRTKIHNLKSASKSIVSALVGLVIDDGSLSLGDSVVEVLDVQGVEPDRRAITVRDVLMMASGLESTSYEAYNAWIAGSDWVRGALRQERLDPPGTRYRYSTGNTHLLSALVRRAAGQSTRSFAEARLFDPVGIEVGGWETDPQGIHIGGNNLALTPRDMAKFGELFLRGGRWGDRQVVPADWVRESTRIQISADHEVYGDYGYQWFVSRRIPGDFVAVGFGGQYIYVSPAYDSVVVVTSTLESKGREWEHRIFDVIEQDLLRADGVRTTSRPIRSDGQAYGPAGAVAVAGDADRPSDRDADLRAQLTSARAQVSTLEERVDTLVSQRDEDAVRLRQLVERSEEDRQQAQVELERSRRALEESGRERSRLAQLLEEAERREHLRDQEMADERERAATAAAGQEAEVTRLRRLVADTNDQLAALQSQNQAADLELERIRSELTRLERRVEDRDATVRDRDAVLDQQLESFEEERSELEAQLAEERGRADQTLREVQRMRQAEATMRDDLETRARELSTARERAKLAEQALQARDARLASLQTDVETLRAQGRADAAEREELNQSLTRLEERANTAVAEQRRLEARVAELSGSEELSQARGDELAELRTARAVESERREQAEQQVATMRASLAEERTRVVSLESEVSDLRSRLAAQEQSDSEAASASAELARVRGDELVALRASHRAEVEQRQDAEQQIGTLRESLARAEAELESVESDRNALRTRLAAQQRSGSDDAAAAQQAQQRVASLEAEIVDLREQNAGRRREAEQLAQRLEESQQATRMQAQQLADLRAELGASQEQTAELEAETRRLREDLRSAEERLQLGASRESEALEAARSRVLDLGRLLDAAREEAEVARSRAAEFEQQLQQERAGIQNQNTQLADLRGELRASNERIVDLQGRLDEVRRTSEARRVALEQAEAATLAAREDTRVGELLAQLESRDRSLAALQQELELAQATAGASPEPGAGDDLVRVRQNYEALVAESEMLARRSGEQGQRIRELEQRLAATRGSEDLDRELRAVRVEVERLLADRRLSEVFRADLQRLRRVLVALQSARERDG